VVVAAAASGSGCREYWHASLRAVMHDGWPAASQTKLTWCGAGLASLPHTFCDFGCRYCTALWLPGAKTWFGAKTSGLLSVPWRFTCFACVLQVVVSDVCEPMKWYMCMYKGQGVMLRPAMTLGEWVSE
jgi:hypothetical protein